MLANVDRYFFKYLSCSLISSYEITPNNRSIIENSGNADDQVFLSTTRSFHSFFLFFRRTFIHRTIFCSIPSSSECVRALTDCHQLRLRFLPLLYETCIPLITLAWVILECTRYLYRERNEFEIVSGR